MKPRHLRLIAAGAGLVGLGSWATGTLVGGVIALWSFVLVAVLLALVLPLPQAAISPLFVGLAGWLVDMLPLVILAGWAAVVARWVFELLRERRMPRGGRWVWLPIALVVWTALGVIAITGADLKHFVLLVGIQTLSSGILLMAVDRFGALTDKVTIATGLVAFVVIMSVGVFAQWMGVPVESLQNDETRRRVEEAYGVDAFPNNLGMLKYARSSKGGAREFRAELDRFAADRDGFPRYEVFLPKFQAFDTVNIVVRFDGSARDFEDELDTLDVVLVYDNVGLAPAATVPRMRAFSRNSLTYAGICVAILPFAFFLAWTTEGRRKLLARVGIAACLFGAGFSLARGAWVAIPIGIAYVLIDGRIAGYRKMQMLAAFFTGAFVLTAVFLFKYDVDPISARAGGDASIATRGSVYSDTVDAVNGLHFLVGYGTERPRAESGVSHELGRYIPKAGTHSTYLNYLFRTGVPGALMIIALYLTAALHSRARARRTTGDERLFATLTTASVVSLAAHAVILSLFVEPIYTMTVSMVLGLAVAGATQLDASVWPWKTRTVP